MSSIIHSTLLRLLALLAVFTMMFFYILYISFSGIKVSVVEKGIQGGDTIYGILTEHGLEPSDVLSVINAMGHEVAKDVKIGDVIYIYHDTENKRRIFKIVIRSDDSDIVITSFEGDHRSRAIKRQKHEIHKLSTGTIDISLYSAAKASGVDNHTISDMISLYSYIIDFQRDIRHGDKYTVFYKTLQHVDGSSAKGGHILHASLATKGKVHNIYRYEFEDGIVDYRYKDGKSIRTMLLKTPIPGSRISSGFGRRKHPILGFGRMHRGLDYAAPKGTPIFSAGDGVVMFARINKRGYGKHVKIRHNSQYQSLYGHMSKIRKGIKKGAKVSQGDVIGYVGSTGLATGNHLHYEVIKNGAKINPAKVKFPKIPDLGKNDMKRFKDIKEKIDGMMSRH